MAVMLAVAYASTGAATERFCHHTNNGTATGCIGQYALTKCAPITGGVGVKGWSGMEA